MVSTQLYESGDLVRCTAAFTNDAGTPTDPTTVTFKIEPPGATTTTYLYGTDTQLVKDSTGNYHVDWITAGAGTHPYKMIGTGAVQRTVAGSFYVKASPPI